MHSMMCTTIFSFETGRVHVARIKFTFEDDQIYLLNIDRATIQVLVLYTAFRSIWWQPTAGNRAIRLGSSKVLNADVHVHDVPGYSYVGTLPVGVYIRIVMHVKYYVYSLYSSNCSTSTMA